MPICRSAPSPLPYREHKPVRLSRYVVTRRVPLRAANDNRRLRVAGAWQWAIAIGALPTLTAMLLLTRLF